MPMITYWLHDDDGREERFAEEPPGIPCLRIELLGDGFERTLTHNRHRWGRYAYAPVRVRPRGSGWVVDDGRDYLFTVWRRPCVEEGG